jgi:hypothetical protein
MDAVTLEYQVTIPSRNVGQQTPSGGVQDVFRKSEDLERHRLENVVIGLYLVTSGSKVAPVHNMKMYG